MRKYSVLIIAIFLVAISGLFGIRELMVGSSSFLLNKLAPLVLSGKNIIQFKEIINDNSELSAEVFNLRAKEIELENIKEENELLRSQLGVSARKSYDLELVKLFNFSYEEISATAFINKGRKHNIEEGMPVISGKSTLVGVINEVFDSYSKIMLINDRRFKIRVLNESRDQFLAIGDGKNGMELDFVTPRDEFKEKELIISEESEDIPGFLIIGEISSIFHNESSLFKQVKVRPAFLDINYQSGFVIKNF